MTLRRRLAIWYGALLAVVLAVALSVAYVNHVESHDHDVDAAIADMTDRATGDVSSQLALGTGPAEVRLADLHRMLEEPHAVWLFDGARLLDSVGPIAQEAFADFDVSGLAPGWATTVTASRRVRSLTSEIDGTGLRVVTAVDLADVDASNAELRTALLVLAVAAVVVGSAGASVLAGSALRPVARMTATAAEIARSRDFTRRVRVAGDDRDELVRLGLTFDEMLSSLDAAHRQQQRFVGDVSHELRTPLTTIRGNAELLEVGDCDAAEQRQAVAHIRRESERLSRLVDELLVLARADTIEAPQRRRVELDEVLMEVFSELRAVAGPRLRVRGIDPVAVDGERDRLKQLLLVLVDNGLRYAPHGHVELELREEGATAVLEVTDDGIGIAAADAPRVFERFYRGTAARRINATGSGLGLPIANWIVQRHLGTIALSPRPGGGTVVTVRIPRSSIEADTRQLASV